MWAAIWRIQPVGGALQEVCQQVEIELGEDRVCVHRLPERFHHLPIDLLRPLGRRRPAACLFEQLRHQRRRAGASQMRTFA
jgi:hypothetical protein